MVTLNFPYLIQRALLVDRGGESETAQLTLKLNGFSLHAPHFSVLITFRLFVIVSKEMRKDDKDDICYRHVIVQMFLSWFTLFATDL